VWTGDSSDSFLKERRNPSLAHDAASNVAVESASY